MTTKIIDQFLRYTAANQAKTAPRLQAVIEETIRNPELIEIPSWAEQLLKLLYQFRRYKQEHLYTIERYLYKQEISIIRRREFLLAKKGDFELT